MQGGILLALVVILGYSIINALFSNIVAPRLYGKGLNLSPVVTLVSILFWGWLLGPIGAMLSIPLTVLIKGLVLENYAETRWLALATSSGQGEDKQGM